jgi:hypothetical protein
MFVTILSFIVAMEKIRKKLFDRNQNTCDVSCPSLISDGLGRWINGTWTPFSQGKFRRRRSIYI